MHEMGGAAERAGATTMSIARALRIQSGLPEKLWLELMLHAIRLYNMLPQRGLLNERSRSPYERAYGTKPQVGHLRIIGLKVYAKVPAEVQVLGNKLAARAKIGWLLGQESHSICGIWILETARLLRVRDVVIDEATLHVYKDRETAAEVTEKTAERHEI
jgi:hypothetical protein